MKRFLKIASITISVLPVAFAGDFMTQVNRVGVIEKGSFGAGGLDADWGSKNISFSSDGRFIVFQSNASNIVAGDTNKLSDIFHLDTLTMEVSRISTSSLGQQSNAASFDPKISGDGAFVVFASNASNLVAGDSNNSTDIFVRDIANGTTFRVSIGESGVEADASSTHPSISDDGNVVGFVSSATNLIGTADTNDLSDFYVHDIENNSTIRASVSSTGTEGNGFVEEGVVSGNGMVAIFTSTSTNMVPSDSNGCLDVFYRDLVGGTTSLVSSDISSNFGNRVSSQPEVSNDGTLVTFTSRSSNLVANDNNGYKDIFVKNMVSGSVSRLSLTSEDDEVQFNTSNSSSDDVGQFIVFQSLSPDFAALDNNKKEDVFVKDTLTGVVKLLSVDEFGASANGRSSSAEISGDGSVIGFESIGSNLVDSDGNSNLDIFYVNNPLERILMGSLEKNGFNQLNQTINFSIDNALLSESIADFTFTSSGSEITLQENQLSDEELSVQHNLKSGRNRLVFIGKDRDGNRFAKVGDYWAGNGKLTVRTSIPSLVTITMTTVENSRGYSVRFSKQTVNNQVVFENVPQIVATVSTVTTARSLIKKSIEVGADTIVDLY